MIWGTGFNLRKKCIAMVVGDWRDLPALVFSGCEYNCGRTGIALTIIVLNLMSTNHIPFNAISKTCIYVRMCKIFALLMSHTYYTCVYVFVRAKFLKQLVQLVEQRDAILASSPARERKVQLAALTLPREEENLPGVRLEDLR